MSTKETKIQSYQNHLEKMSNGAELISGIYNYCDRWCERCTMKKHCSIYYMELDEDNNSATEIKDNLDRVSDIFSLTMEMLQEVADEMGLDLSDLPEVDIPEHIPSELENIANAYGEQINKWLIANHESFREYAEKLSLVNEGKADNILDAMMIINWYSSMIGAKINRAMSSDGFKIDEADDTDFQDQLGSAKVALISIDNSINAIDLLLNTFPEEEGESLSFLATLSKIKRLLFEEYPNAMSFKRPGFDK